jgi:demethylmenaquinone methyltransferase/2-methoxy-6-polyprenyl-1,4-benzoquinol methylase
LNDDKIRKEQPTMIAAREFSTEQIKRAYNRRSWLYSKTVAEMERGYHLVALEQAKVQPGENVLEVAVGPGLTLIQLAELVGKDQPIHGVDLSTSMLELTRQRLLSSGFHNFVLKEADSRALPFADGSFDLLYNAYMLDLIPERDMPLILAEFKRVLRPAGRLVLLNMSKPGEAPTAREKLYRLLPANITLYLMGACRPVLMKKLTEAAGFTQVTRTFLNGKAPSEIVLGIKP